MFIFFFKQKTAYEMRISDWSSDVCSSDLLKPRRDRGMARMPLARLHRSLQIAQIKALDIAPDNPCRMLRSKQAVQVDSSQLDLIALRLQKPRQASRRPSLRLENGRASCREIASQDG